MAFIRDALKSVFLTPIGYKDCKEGFTEGTTPKTEGLCFPDIEKHPELQPLFKQKKIKIYNPDAPIQEVIWERAHMDAEPFNTASSSNCDPGTIPLNGTCFQNCPPNTIVHTYEMKGETFVECLTECDKGWHELNWKSISKSTIPIFEPGNVSFLSGDTPFSKYQQVEEVKPYWCYHLKSGTSSDISNTDNYTSIPYTLLSMDGSPGKIVGQGDNRITLHSEGLYAERLRAPLGAPVMAGDCPPPGRPSGIQCLKPTPIGFKVEKNQWITTEPCPSKFSDIIDEDITKCIPKSVARGKYGTLASILFQLIIIVIVALLIIKLITGLRR